MDGDKKRGKLMARLQENYADYRAGLLAKDKTELIDSAEEIAHVMAAYEDVTGNHEFSDSQLTHFLKFQNPLEVIAAHWPDVATARADLQLYPLVTDARPRDSLRKFMDVDLIASLQSIMEQVTVYYQSDFEYDKKNIQCASWEVEPDGKTKNFYWLCRKNGTHMYNEREALIRGTSAFNTLQFYGDEIQSRDPVVFYTVEVTGTRRGKIRGNIYERDIRQYAEFAKRTASPYMDVSLTFANGLEKRIPQEKYDAQTYKNLEYEYGKIVAARPEPEEEGVVQEALTLEHGRREGLKKGSILGHAAELNDSRIQAEADRILSGLGGLPEPNSPEKKDFMVPLSDDFILLSGTKDMDKLTDRLAVRFPGREFYFTVPDGGKKPCFFIRPEAVRETEKPSIKEQLAAPPVPGEKPAQKVKGMEAR